MADDHGAGNDPQAYCNRWPSRHAWTGAAMIDAGDSRWSSEAIVSANACALSIARSILALSISANAHARDVGRLDELAAGFCAIDECGNRGMLQMRRPFGASS